MDLSRISWQRIGVEGAVIVASILLAFAIDAWWDEQGARDAEIEQLTRVAQEVRSNSERLEEKLRTIERAIEATEEFMSWMGPEPANVTPAVYHEHWHKFFSIGMFSLARAASQEYLATGIAGKARHQEIRSALAQWHSSADDLETQYGLLRVAHARINDYTEDLVPAFHTILESGVITGELTSRFPYDHHLILSDPFMESRMATYLIRMEFVVGQARSAMRMQTDLLSLIEAATSE